MQPLRQVSLLAASVCLTACGTILNGTRQNIGVQSAPAGAHVETAPATGVSTTPTTLNLERKNSYVLTFSAAGYSPATFNIHNNMNGLTVVADILLTGLLGVIVDAATGAWYSLSPETATVSLTRTTAMEGPDTIEIRVGESSDGKRVQITSDAPGVQVQVTRIHK